MQKEVLTQTLNVKSVILIKTAKDGLTGLV